MVINARPTLARLTAELQMDPGRTRYSFGTNAPTMIPMTSGQVRLLS